MMAAQFMDAAASRKSAEAIIIVVVIGGDNQLRGTRFPPITTDMILPNGCVT